MASLKLACRLRLCWFERVLCKGIGGCASPPARRSIPCPLEECILYRALCSLVICSQDTNSYFASSTGTEVVLSSWARINAGGPALGPETRGDPGYRTWQGDAQMPGQGGGAASWKAVSTPASISIAPAWAPLNLPTAMFQTAREVIT